MWDPLLRVIVSILRPGLSAVVLHVGGADGVVEALGEGVGVAGGEACGREGVADDDQERAGVQRVDVDGEQLVGADEGRGMRGTCALMAM